MNDTTRTGLCFSLLLGLLLIPAASLHGLSIMEFRTGLFVREILRNGPSLIPRLDGSPYYDYPPLYFLAAALSSTFLRSVTPLSLALPSILSAMGTMVVLSLFAGKASPVMARTACLALISTPLFLDVGSQATVDAMLTFFICLALSAYYMYLSSGKARHLLLSLAGLAGGALTKGPVGVAIPLAVIFVYLALQRRGAAIVKTFLQMGVFLLLLGMVIYKGVAITEGQQAIRELIDAQILDRFKDEANVSAFHYVGVLFAGFGPWSVFAALQLGRRNRGGAGAAADLITYSKVWLTVTFLMLSLASTKHGRYLLPAAPPVAILCAAFWEELMRREGTRRARAIMAPLHYICASALLGVLLFSITAPLRLPFLSPLLIAGIPALCIIALWQIARGEKWSPDTAFCALAWSVVIGFLTYCQFVLPLQSAKEESRPFVEMVEREAGDTQIIFFDISKDKDGLRYLYWRRGNNMLTFTEDIEEIQRALDSQSSSILVVPRDETEVLTRLPGLNPYFLFEGRLGKERCALFRISH
ncbi:MAG: glycosyltransferase family 39 protein [Candidatus Aureabacteria bacterium]|nr:glycosyltransferase family 39 protein [Candidatus Auribacterota bacterium]